MRANVEDTVPVDGSIVGVDMPLYLAACTPLMTHPITSVSLVDVQVKIAVVSCDILSDLGG